MKRMWIGVGLLALVLLGGILGGHWIHRTHSAGAVDMDRAAELVLEEDWQKAQAYALRAKKQWNETRTMTAMLADHEPVYEIDALFSQLDAYWGRDREQYSGLCRLLGARLRAMGENHRLNLGNLL